MAVTYRKNVEVTIDQTIILEKILVDEWDNIIEEDLINKIINQLKSNMEYDVEVLNHYNT